VFHPTTTKYGSEWQEVEELLAALERLALPTIFLWPNIDAGADHISKALRTFRSVHGPAFLRMLTNLSPEDYLLVLANAACAVGNSSSFVRDASFLGTPVVIVGSRQSGRELAPHATTVEPVRLEIDAAIRAQLAHGPYAPSSLYGDGAVAPRVAEALATLEPYVQKRLHFVS
jgi:UDP-N-acetylglucosamine 2-epimerase